MRTFIWQNIADELNLNAIRREKLSVYTFGSKTPLEKTYDVALITLENKNFPESKVELEALVTDEICCSNIPPPLNLIWYH